MFERTSPNKGRPEKITDATRWLKIFLSGGHRMANDIQRAGKESGFGLVTLKRAKAKLGFQSTRVGATAWAWKDPAVIEKQLSPDATLQEQLLQEMKELKRLNQPPTPETSAEDFSGSEGWTDRHSSTEQIDTNAVDDWGFRKHYPFAGQKITIKPSEILARIKQAIKDGEDKDQVRLANEIFDWAYPACGFAETIIAQMLRNEYIHAKRQDIKSLQVPDTPTF